MEIPLPPLATQQAIVAEIEAEQSLVAANRDLITRFEQKIQTTLARIWGDDPAKTIPFSPAAEDDAPAHASQPELLVAEAAASYG